MTKPADQAVKPGQKSLSDDDIATIRHRRIPAGGDSDADSDAAPARTDRDAPAPVAQTDHDTAKTRDRD